MIPPLPPLVWLASQSPRRRELLTQIGVACRLLLPEPGEDAEALEAERSGESPDDYVRRVTRAKLDAARARFARACARDGREAHPPAPILCADTTVAVDGAILGKPADADDARRMLRRLSGRRHRVLTAVAVACTSTSGEAPVLQALSVSDVAVASLDDAAIDAYLATGEPFGKAGAYAIQGAFAAWVERIDGSHSGIVGLPLFETAALLRAAAR